MNRLERSTEQCLKKLFESKYRVPAQTVVALAGAGSDRKYYRLSAQGVSAIGVYGTNRADNERFVYLAHTLSAAGVNVPEVYAVAEDGLCYLQQDLGNKALFDLVKDGNQTVIDTYITKCMRALPSLQLCRHIQYDMLCEPYGRRMILRDLNYFKYCMLKTSGVDPDEDLLDDDFDLLATTLAHTDDLYCGLMYRDCQSRNVMLLNETPYWIDFQGARRGPVLYDVASFLWQARAGFSAETRARGVEEYISAYTSLRPDADAAQMRRLLPGYVLLRQLQVLGAYGFRGLIEHKAHFVMSIDPAIKNISDLIAQGACDCYPELKRCIQQLIAIWNKRTVHGADNRLTIYVFSFSYKKGYPADYSGNGGGFMFDCRGMHNPGRYEQYKHLTGRDKPVIDFLEERGEVQRFMQGAESMVDTSVERYIRRGFSSLQIGFGCTGGQHRSVYCAEAMARHLREKFPEARVVLCHREQGISYEL